MITDTVKLNAVIEVVKGLESKAQIAKKYKISPRSLGRYIEKFEAEALTFVNKEPEMNAETQEVKSPTTAINPMSFMVQQGIAAGEENAAAAESEKVKKMRQPAKTRSVSTGAASDKVTVKGAVISVMTKFKNENKTSKEFRAEAVSEIMSATGLDEKLASKYYAGYKKIVFG